MGDEASALIFDDEDGEDGSAKKKHTKRKSVRGADREKGDGSPVVFSKVEESWPAENNEEKGWGKEYPTLMGNIGGRIGRL